MEKISTLFKKQNDTNEVTEVQIWDNEAHLNINDIKDRLSTANVNINAINTALGNKIGYCEILNDNLIMYTDTTKKVIVATVKLPTSSSNTGTSGSGGSTVTASTTNGNIKVDGSEVKVYTHPTTAGNKHIPSGGSSGQFLGYKASGEAQWVNAPASSTGGSIVTASTTNGNIKVDGSEVKVYTHPTTDGNLHLPSTSSASANQVLKLNSSKQAVWANETGGSSSSGGAVNDITVDGSSILGSDGIAIMPIATEANKLGLSKVSTTYGIITTGSGQLRISKASEINIDERSDFKPIVPMNLDYAVKQALTDGKGAAYTAEEMKKARERLGIVTLSQSEYEALVNKDPNTIYLTY